MVTEDQAREIMWALKLFHANADSYSTARNYYKGFQRLAFNTDKFNNAFGKMFKAFADNVCPTIVETLKDRLKLDGFTIEDKQIQADIDELWRRNRMRVRTGEVHLDTVIEGDGYLIVWPDAQGNPIFYPNRANAVVIEYDDEQPGWIVRAAKTWQEKNTGKQRLTLYYPDRIEKYITQQKVEGGLPDNANPFIQFDGAEAWPLPNPYNKVPVFHFGNRAGIGTLGMSELSEVIPLQDALNKTIGDMLVNSEFYGIPQRWATGIENTGDVAEMKQRYSLSAGGIWGTDKSDVKFGSFAVGDPDKYILVIENFRKEIARVARTPLHYFDLGTRVPSGEALKTAEAPLLAKVQDRQETWGPVWSDCMRFALQIMGKGDYEPEPKWADTSPRSDKEQADIGDIKVNKLGIPEETVWSEMGYSQKKIDEMKKIIAAKPPLAPVINPANAARNAFQKAPPAIHAMFGAGTQ